MHVWLGRRRVKFVIRRGNVPTGGLRDFVFFLCHLCLSGLYFLKEVAVWDWLKISPKSLGHFRLLLPRQIFCPPFYLPSLCSGMFLTLFFPISCPWDPMGWHHSVPSSSPRTSPHILPFWHCLGIQRISGPPITCSSVLCQYQMWGSEVKDCNPILYSPHFIMQKGAKSLWNEEHN